MIIHPAIVTVVSSVLALLIVILGYFLNRTLIKQDEQNKEQSKINKELRECFDNLNKTLAGLLIDKQWSKEVCAERHRIITEKLAEIKSNNQ